MNKLKFVIFGLSCVGLGLFIGRKGMVIFRFTKDAFGKGSFNKIINEVSEDNLCR